MSTYNCTTDILKMKYPNLEFKSTYTICVDNIVFGKIEMQKKGSKNTEAQKCL